MTRGSSSVTKYLGRWAEADARAPGLAELAALGPWDHAVVIPARREAADCLRVVAAPARRGRCLCVLVVNAADDPVDLASAEALCAEVEARPSAWRGVGLSLHELGDYELLLVDGCRGARRFGPREGVGRARKLGADLIVALAQLGALRHPWIHTTDADARLPSEHFERVVEAGTCVPAPVAALAPFWHTPSGDARIDAATAAYELELRYYVAGLRHAGSPYAFHTIGSTISVHAPAYVAARGFPQREAGEDFYLLTKLAKLGPIAGLGGAPVEIRARRSTRAPFGTGPAVEAKLGGARSEVYDPRVFEVLAELEAALAAAARGEGLARLEGLARAHELDELDRCVAAMRTLIERYPPTQLDRRLPEAFDGFHTLKLIHALTRARWPKLEWAQAVLAAPFIDFGPGLELDAQRRRLAALEAVGLGPTHAGG